ncbi:ABC transporter ATP-binding protein [Nocardioides litoris]|uniref:ABC transporter ATP-binding protein n=1 Tax=Nocardioides litoris TaxID=1926648 RepID=UPI001B869086|nr:ATP-binding cassette domain-containing protein [Nocardioides litoris]
MSRRFGGLLAVREVDMQLEVGTKRALLGPNGAGKTTLVNLIAGAVPTSEGTIELFGADVTEESGRRRVARGLARTYQESKLFSGLSVEDNIALALIGSDGGLWRPAPGGRAQRARRERARELAARVHLTRLMGDRAAALSHGAKRQLELAMALASRPRVLVLDEPAAGLSPSEREMLTQLLHDLDRDLTLLLIEHDMNVALAVTDSVTVMADGRVVFEGTPDEVVASDLVHEIYLGVSHV